MKTYRKGQAILWFFFLIALLVCIFSMAYSVYCSVPANKEVQSSKPCEQSGADVCEGRDKESD